MKIVDHPAIENIELLQVLRALSDPVRLTLTRMLAESKDLSCNTMCLGRPKSSMSHHFKAMVNAGLLRVEIVGNTHVNNLRTQELEQRFPGLLSAILGAS